jgi:hypothetical protein
MDRKRLQETLQVITVGYFCNEANPRGEDAFKGFRSGVEVAWIFRGNIS